MNKFLSYIYTLICVISPLLVIYSFFQNSYTIPDTLIILFYFLTIPIIFFGKGLKITPTYAVLFVFILIHSIVFLLNENNRSNFLRAMHLANYILFLSLYHKYFFNSNFAEKMMRYIAIFSTLFLIIQQIAKIRFGIDISGILLPQYTIVQEDLENQVQGTSVYRLSSFFSEPAAYASYIICALTHELFYIKKTSMLVVSLLCFGCVLSTSNTAIACMVLLMGFYIYTNKTFRDRNTLLLIASLIIIYYVATPHIEAINARIDSGKSFEGRFLGYRMITQLVENPLWGIGFVSSSELGVYLAGFARLFVYLGGVGIFLYSIIYLNIYLNTYKKILLLVFLFLNIGSDTFFGISLLYYSCFFLTSKGFYRDKIIYRNDKFQQLQRT